MKSNPAGGFGIDEILKILPHRYPFVMLDRVIELTPHQPGSRVGRKTRATKCVSFGEPYFSGHFPHRAVMPGVLIIEAMAQAAAIASWRPSDPKMDVAIARVGEVRVRRPVTPGDVLELTAEVVKDRGDMLLIKTAAKVDGELVTETEILASVTPANLE